MAFGRASRDRSRPGLEEMNAALCRDAATPAKCWNRLAVRGDLVTDGQLELVGDATNINVLRDEGGATNGAIQGSLHFAFAPEMARAVGSYLFRFSSPSNHFPVSTVPFTVVSAPYGPDGKARPRGLIWCPSRVLSWSRASIRAGAR